MRLRTMFENWNATRPASRQTSSPSSSSSSAFPTPFRTSYQVSSSSPPSALAASNPESSFAGSAQTPDSRRVKRFREETYSEQNTAFFDQKTVQENITQEISLETRKANGVTFEIFWAEPPEVELSCEKIKISEFWERIENTRFLLEKKEEERKVEAKSDEGHARQSEEVEQLTSEEQTTPGENEAIGMEMQETQRRANKRKQEDDSSETTMRYFKATDVILIDSKNFPGSSDLAFGRREENCCLAESIIKSWKMIKEEERPTLLWVFDVQTRVEWSAEVLARWSRLG